MSTLQSYEQIFAESPTLAARLLAAPPATGLDEDYAMFAVEVNVVQNGMQLVQLRELIYLSALVNAGVAPPLLYPGCVLDEGPVRAAITTALNAASNGTLSPAQIKTVLGHFQRRIASGLARMFVAHRLCTLNEGFLGDCGGLSSSLLPRLILQHLHTSAAVVGIVCNIERSNLITMTNGGETAILRSLRHSSTIVCETGNYLRLREPSFGITFSTMHKSIAEFRELLVHPSRSDLPGRDNFVQYLADFGIRAPGSINTNVAMMEYHSWFHHERRSTATRVGLASRLALVLLHRTLSQSAEHRPCIFCNCRIR
jgi:hypothetical protein